MRRFLVPRLTLRRKVLLSHLAVLLPLVAFFLAASAWGSRALDLLFLRSEAHLRDQHHALRLRNELLQADDAAFRYIATGSRRYRLRAEQAARRFESLLASDIEESPQEGRDLLREADRIYRTGYRPWLMRRLSGSALAGEAGTAEQAMQDLSRLLDRYILFHERGIESTRRAMAASNTRLEALLALGTAASLLLATGASFAISWLLLRPVREMERVVRAFERGDLTARPDHLPEDEIGDFGRAFGRAIHRIDAQQRLLHAMAITDPLTGLYNRRRLDQILENLSPEDAPVTVAMLDLDHFKAWNDRYGHPAGDQLLREVGALFRANLRVGDVAARYGGEEFCLLLFESGDAGEAAGRVVLERLHRVYSRHEFTDPQGKPLGRITVSIGGTLWRSHEPVAAAIRRADEALFRAKERGRDRVEWTSA